MNRAVILFVLLLSLCLQSAVSWRYETRCTRVIDPSKSDTKPTRSPSNSIIDDLELDSASTDDAVLGDDDYTSPPSSSSSSASNQLTLRCPNMNDFLFIGLTQYGVMSSSNRTNNVDSSLCQASTSDCLVTVDYLANECNGLNSCRIQLDAQFLHSCKRHSDYLSLAYECIPGAQRVDVCSSDETFLIDSTLNTNKAAASSSSSSLSRFGAFYLTSPGYPNEYADNLKSCSCRLEYVKIESSPVSLISTPTSSSSNTGGENKLKDTAEISLALSAYEFDLEEGNGASSSSSSSSNEDTNKCNKDYFNIETDAKNETICGHYKEFREFYAHGQQVSLNFQSDDFITRRGFLFKISTIPRTQCPPNASARFDSTRCLSLHSERLVSWSEASRSCVSRGGRLLAINDFVDAMRMSASVRSGDDVSTQYWVAASSSSSNRKSSGKKPAKCVSKSVNGWHDEKSCGVKRPYICEYDAVKSSATPSETMNRGMSDTNGNRLIRVACGQAATLFGAASSSSIFEKTSSTTTTTPNKSIASNSIKNTQRPDDKPLLNKASTVSALIIDYDDEYDQESGAASTTTSKSAIITTSTLAVSNSNESQKSRLGFSFLSQDYLIIIAIVCGFAIVLIAINIFCIWNYYNKKLNGHFRRDFAIIPEVHNSFRQSSTLLSKSGKNTNRNTSTSSSSTTSSNGVSGVTNRTLTSCLGVVSNAGGTYIRVPVYDLNNPRESTDSGISGASFKQLTPAECLRVLLNGASEENSELANHYYETLSKRQQHQQQVVNLGGEYHVYNPLEATEKFDSMVVMPTLLVPNSVQQQQSTVVLLTTTNPTSGYPTSIAVPPPPHKASQYSSIIYGDLGTSYGGSSTASGGSSKPLLSFVANNNNANNASSISAAENESVTISDSSSPSPNI